MQYFNVGNARRRFALKMGVLRDLPLRRRASRVRRFVIQDWCGVAMASGTGGPWQLASEVGA